MIDEPSFKEQARRLQDARKSLVAAAVNTPDLDVRREIQEAIAHVQKAESWLTRTQLGSST